MKLDLSEVQLSLYERFEISETSSVGTTNHVRGFTRYKGLLSWKPDE